MWKNWIPFRRKEEKRTDKASVAKENERSGLKGHPTTIDRSGRNGAGGPPTDMTTRWLSSSASANTDSNASANWSPVQTCDKVGRPLNRNPQTGTATRSVLNASGPLLATPLLPKIRRAIELNESFSGRSASSLSRSRVSRSVSLNYGPTHPVRSTPGRLPTVRLQRRPSLHNISGRSVQSPTVKVAPPDLSVLSGPSFRISPVRSEIPAVQNVVDTQMVVAALKERRKRSNIQAEESFVEGDVMQTAKRRRQDSIQSNTSSVSMPSMPDVMPDLSRDQSSVSSLVHIENMSLKRPSVPTTESYSTPNLETVTAKQGRKEARSSILSSLSSSRRAREKKMAAEETQAEKRKRLASISDVENTQPVKRLTPSLQKQSEKGIDDARTPATSSARQNGTRESTDSAKDKTCNSAETAIAGKQHQSETFGPKKTRLLDLMSHSKRPSAMSFYPSLKTPPAFQTMTLVSPADLEQDRKEEEARRVQDFLAYLDEEEKPESDFLSKPAETTLSSATLTSTMASVTPLTTASSLSELLTSRSSTVSSVLAVSSSQLSSSHTLTAKSTAAPTAGLNTVAGLFGSAANSPLVQSTGTSLSQPTCSTSTSGTGFLSISSQTLSTSTPAASVQSTAPASSSQGAASSAALQSPTVITSTQQDYTFKPVFGTAKATPPAVSASNPPLSAGGFSFPGSASVKAPSMTSMAPSTSLPGGFSLGVNSSTTVQSVAMTGCMPTASISSTSLAQPFTFGARNVTAPVSSANGGFTSTLTIPPTVAVSTSSSGCNDAQPNSSTGFSFGAAVTASDSSASMGFPVEQSSSTTMQTGGRGLQPKNLFGANPITTCSINSSHTTTLAFGQTASSLGTPSGSLGFSTTTTTTPAVFGFGQSAPATTANTFGMNAVATTSSSGPFTFGAPVSTGASGTFSFGQTPACTAATTGAFTFGTSAAPATNSGFSFGAPPATTSSGGFGFGAVATTASSNTFSFGVSSAGNTGPVFGQVLQGTANGNSGFSFGANQEAQNSAPAFGAAQTQAPAFGTTQPMQTQSFGSQQTFTFGNTSSTTGFNFGGTASTAKPPPAFGSTGQDFGGSQLQRNTPAFGALANQSAPTTTAGSTFQFGAGGTQAPAPFTFGAPQTQTSGGGGFPFAQVANGSNNGFNFSAAAAGAPQFNFGAGGSGQNMFTTGAGSTAAKPRAAAPRARRRGNRR